MLGHLSIACMLDIIAQQLIIVNFANYYHLDIDFVLCPHYLVVRDSIEKKRKKTSWRV